MSSGKNLAMGIGLAAVAISFFFFMKKKPQIKQEIPVEIEALLTATALGFQPKSKSTSMKEINRYAPSGGTAMRDAVAMGVLKMIAL